MSKYVVVQYVPDAVTGERINIGVVVTSEGKARSIFLDNWQRVRQFAGSDVSFLKNLQREAVDWDEATVNRLASQWTGSIQFTEPRHSILTADALMVDAVKRFLSEHASAERGYRGKADAVRIIRNRIKEKMVERSDSGRLAKHSLKIGTTNFGAAEWGMSSMLASQTANRCLQRKASRLKCRTRDGSKRKLPALHG